MIDIIKNEDDLVKKYNKISENGLSLNLTLSDLSYDDLFIYIVGKTYKYGRDFTSSIENAKYHMKDRNNAIKIFSRKRSQDTLLM